MNNVNNFCPARMSDGRHFTDYRPNCSLDGNIRTQNNIHSSFEFRSFLQENANKLMELNRSSAINNNGCSSCSKPSASSNQCASNYVYVINDKTDPFKITALDSSWKYAPF